MCANNKWYLFYQRYGLAQLINKPTCITEYTSILNDHIYTCPGRISERSVPTVTMSDHLPVHVCLTRRAFSIDLIDKSEHKVIKYRCFKRFCKHSFLRDILKSVFRDSQLLEPEPLKSSRR